ncbi:MAG: zinc-dependent metalloprotease, partial [Segatella oulorum]
EKLYWGISQARYALFQQVLSNVGGIYINNMKISSGVPRYQVVSKALQQRSLQWVLQQAVHFTDYADRAFERKGFMAVSYYDQSLEYMAYEILAARTRVAVSAYLNPATYSQKDYFDDVFNVFFKSAAEQRAPSQGERIMQRTFMNYAQAAVSKVTGSGSSSGASGGRAAFMQAETSTTPGFGDPGLNLSPNVDLNIADNSELYFYNSLLRLRPLLQKCLKGNLPLAAKTHYEMLLFKLNKTMEVKK